MKVLTSFVEHILSNMGLGVHAQILSAKALQNNLTNYLCQGFDIVEDTPNKKLYRAVSDESTKVYLEYSINSNNICTDFKVYERDSN